MASRGGKAQVGRVPALAKLTRPSATSIYLRTRLFRVLDRVRESPIVWISAPAGAGKTTLVASYTKARDVATLWYQVDGGDIDVASFFYYMGLGAKAFAPRQRGTLPLFTLEHHTGLPAFTTNYFRALFARMKGPAMLVLDNYQEAGNDGVLHDVLQQGFDQISPGINVVVLSREEPPEAFAHQRAGGRLALIEWNDLKLTEEESAGIAKLRGKRSPLAPAGAKALHEETQGWVAGLVLLTERLEETSLGPAPPDALGTQSIFDYFANEIFRHGGAATQSFLLKTAFVPRVSVAIARALTGDESSGAILCDLTRRNYFTVKHPDGSYEYHPLFRAFLANRAVECHTAEEIAQLKRRCAEILAQSGEVQAAVALLQQVQDWDEALRLILLEALALVSQGRTQTIEAWLQNFPAEVFDSNPWILYWRGVCRLPYSLREARELFERAFALFERGQDASPLYLAWSGIVESTVLEFNDFTSLGVWLDRYPALGVGRTPPTPRVLGVSVFAYVLGLAYVRFDHPDLEAHAIRAQELLKHVPDPARQLTLADNLFVYYFWRGDTARMRTLLEGLASSARAPETRALGRISWLLCWSAYKGVTGDLDESTRAVTDALALANSSGIHIFDGQLIASGVYSYLGAGNVVLAREMLERMASIARPGEIDQLYHTLTSIVSLHEGDLVCAIDEARRAADLAKANGLMMWAIGPQLCIGYALARLNDSAQALDVIGQCRAVAEQVGSERYIYNCIFAEAYVRYLQGDRDRCLRALSDALEHGRAMDVVTPVSCPRDAAAALYAMALDADIHSEYVRTTIARTRLPPPRSVSSEKWPWQVRVYTFGGFAVVTDGAPLTFKGRAQRKPLELLRALVTCGGRGVAATKLAQMLWPDAEGDMAEHALETTLYRLRKLLGENSIETNDGQLSFNADRCWLDIWAFERLVESPPDVALPAVQTSRLLDLYRGPFLEGDDSPAVSIQRDRLHSKFLRAVGQLGEVLEAEADYQRAISCYHKGIEADPLAEELYRRLMRSYRRLGRSADALAIYQRCRSTLMSVLRIEPAPETKSLYAEIRQGGS